MVCGCTPTSPAPMTALLRALDIFPFSLFSDKSGILEENYVPLKHKNKEVLHLETWIPDCGVPKARSF